MRDDERAEQEYLSGHLEEALASDPRVAEPSLEVHVSGRSVVIRGEVATQERRAAVEDVAREVAPDRAIHNETTVLEPREPGQPEVLP